MRLLFHRWLGNRRSEIDGMLLYGLARISSTLVVRVAFIVQSRIVAREAARRRLDCGPDGSNCMCSKRWLGPSCSVGPASSASAEE